MKGLTTSEVKQEQVIFGFNEIKDKKPSILVKFIKWIISPIALMLLAAALLSLFAKNIFDFYFILVLMLLNFFISFWQENKADQAIEKLQEHLTVKVKTLRDGIWQSIATRNLVPGDVIELEVGDIIPADSTVIKAKNLTVNEAALTGESFPKDKKDGDNLISGSFITTGATTAEVTATGENTSFGKTLKLADNTKKRSLLEQDILRISKFLSFLSLIAVIILTVTLSSVHAPWLEIVLLDLSVVIAGIPISLPTVMSLIIGFGVLELAKKNTVVRQLSALEDLANVDLLLSDKTGTLTKNAIRIEKIINYSNKFSENDVVSLAFTTTNEERNPIAQAVINKYKELNILSYYKVIETISGDSERKHSTSIIEDANGHRMCVSIGATQVVEKLCNMNELSERFNHDVNENANNGYRSLAVAINENGETEENMVMLSMLLLSDTLFEDAPRVIDFLKSNGIAVKMLTGDNVAISNRVAQELNLIGNVIDKTTLEQLEAKTIERSILDDTAVFAGILPSDKLKIVELAKKYFRVAVTGDGVNDLPAIKVADVGIAVSGAVDALKSAADIVLLSPGIAVIENSVIEARKIFSRLYSYSIYRISESLRLILTVTILGVLYKMYPLTAIQLILLAFLNDIPIISLAFNRVAVTNRPSTIKVKERFWLSSLFGVTGVINSLLLFYLALNYFHLSLPVIETLFFLKLTIGGHMLIYVAHTDRPWYKFLPSNIVIIATTVTQLLATIIVLSGWLMPKVSLIWVLFIWIWAFVWMQVSELVKYAQNKYLLSKNNLSTNLVV